jgi:C4-dicarboxylate transporter, DctQ subunit
MIEKTIAILTRLDDTVFAAEKATVYTLLLVMASLSFFSVILRLFFNTCFPGCLDLAQNMVLWCTFLGGAIGSRNNRHLNINVLQQFIRKGRVKTIVEIILFLTVAVVAAFLTYSGYRFILSQYEFGEDLPSLGIHLWILQIILPYTFAIVTFRYFLNALRRIAGSTAENEEEQMML